jgi:transketolase
MPHPDQAAELTTQPIELQAPFNLPIEEQQAVATHLRQSVLDVCQAASSGHIGGCSSSVELMTSLYFGDALRYDPNNLRHPDRDLVAMRGHLGPLRYSIFAMLGEVQPEELQTYRRFGSRLQGHEEHEIMPGVDLSPSGSLGMLLSYGVGASVTARNEGLDRMSYIFLGDGEEQEGNVSEAARHAATLGLDNLVAIVDKNGKQLSDPVAECDAADLATMWRGYGWDVLEPIDGHDLKAVAEAYRWARETKGDQPKLIIANTLKGYGVEGAEKHFSGYHTIDVTPKARVEEAVIRLATEAATQVTERERALGTIAMRLEAGPQPARVEQRFAPAHLNIQPTAETPRSLNAAQGEYFKRLREFMLANPDIHDHTFFLTADVTLRKMVDLLGLDEMAGTYMNVGIREQHMVAMAHGIGLTDPQSRIIVNFLDAFTYRSADQLNALAQGGGNIIMINDAAGIANARNGRSHQASGQPGALYSMPGVTVLEPGDVTDMFNCFNWAIGESRGPVVIRTHRSAVEPFAVDPAQRNLNHYVVHDVERPELVIAATGLTVGSSVEAARELTAAGRPTRVVNVLAPNMLDASFMNHVAEGQPLLCAYNGNPAILRDQVAGAVLSRDGPRPGRIHGHGFLLGTSGMPDELLSHYELDGPGILKRATAVLDTRP